MKAKQKTIRKRILSAWLLLSLISLVIISGISEFGMFRLETLSKNGNQNIGDSASESIDIAMTDLSKNSVAALVNSKAEKINEQMKAMKNSLVSLCDYLANLYDHPENYPDIPITILSECPENTLVMQYGLAPGVSKDDPAIQEELNLQGNMEVLYRSIMAAYPDICSIYIATETGVNTGFDEYAQTKADEFEGRTRDFYKVAVKSKKMYISNTYLDTFHRGLMVTLSKAVYKSDGELIGVVGIDVLIEDLNKDILGTTVGTSGYAMMFSKEGKIICAPGLGEEDLGDEKLLDAYLGSAKKSILEDLKADEATCTESDVDAGHGYFFSAPVNEMNWSVVMVLPESDIKEPGSQLTESVQTIITDTSKAQNDQIFLSNMTLIIVFILVILAVSFFASYLSRKIANPIVMLNEAVRKIEGDNLKFDFSLHTGDEIESLSLSFQSLLEKLEEYMVNLTKVTADKERIATEMSVATSIQSGMLPSIFPKFTDNKEFELFATMNPAKEVGGDFYDFFMVDDTHLAIVMADVSGKGVPAALFMVIGKTLIKDHTQPGADLGDVFTKVNNLLCESNGEGLFITAFEGVLDLVTGEFAFVNAGHELPFISKKNEPFAPYKVRRALVLAGMEGMKYKSGVMQLEPGDRIYQYTDGVTEATDVNNQLYGMERLEKILNIHIDKKPELLLPAIKEDIDAFVGEAPQFDDITMLCLEFKDYMVVGDEQVEVNLD